MTRTQTITLVVLAVFVACALYWAASYAINILPAPVETKAIVIPTDSPTTPERKLIVPVGKLSEVDDYPSDGEVFVQKKDGTTDARPNDLEELCKDWLFYRQKISEHTASGDAEKADGARIAFQNVNIYLGEYAESDVDAMFDILERTGYEPP